ncbi:MAG: AAA family ATPase [Nanoarchaeota archaeon]
MLNEFLDLKNGINLVYGEAATGKTTIALMLARDFSKFSKIIFIDTENGFNFERFKQISQEYYEKCLKNILLFKAKSFDEQIRMVKSLENIKDTNLIVIDTIGSYYRLELKENTKEINDRFIDMFKTLRILNKNGTNIFLTNQVYKNFDTNRIENVGGKTVKNFSRVIIKLENSPRRIIKEKPSKIEYLFEIKDDGIKLI